MDICLTCTKVETLPTCTDNLVIGEVTAPGDVTVYFKDITLGGRTQSYPDITPVADVVTIPNFSDPSKSINHSYEVWITEQDANVEDRLDITIGTTVTDCISVRFETIYTADLAAVPYAEQSMVVAS